MLVRPMTFARMTAIALLALGFCSADTLTLRSGRVVTGQYLGGDARHIRMAIGDHVDTFNVEDVGDIEFGGNPPPAPTQTAPAQTAPAPTSDPGQYPARNQGFAQQPPSSSSGPVSP